MRHELQHRNAATMSFPVGSAPGHSQETPEAIHAGDSTSGIDELRSGPLLGLAPTQGRQDCNSGTVRSSA
jgi:hypothetical protein